MVAWPSGQRLHLFAGGSWGATVFIPLRGYFFFFFNGFLLFGFVLFPLRGYFFFFRFIVFLPFGFVLFILTADLVSFARFLRKRISSFRGKLTRCIVRSHM